MNKSAYAAITFFLISNIIYFPVDSIQTSKQAFSRSQCLKCLISLLKVENLFSGRRLDTIGGFNDCGNEKWLTLISVLIQFLKESLRLTSPCFVV